MCARGRRILVVGRNPSILCRLDYEMPRTDSAGNAVVHNSSAKEKAEVRLWGCRTNYNVRLDPLENVSQSAIAPD